MNNDEVNQAEVVMNNKFLLKNEVREITFNYGKNSVLESQEWKEWLMKLGLKIGNAKVIADAYFHASEEVPILEKLHSIAKLAVLDLRAEKYFKPVDDILLAKINPPLDHERRVELYVWRYLLIANKFTSPKNQWEDERNKKFETKLNEINQLLDRQNIAKLEVEIVPMTQDDTPAITVKTTAIKQNGESKPCLIADPKDPQPEQPWHIPARYFARQLIIGDATLLTKRDLLANKVVKSLTAAGFKKRGGKLPFNPATVKKAFSNVSLG